jgi:hypothetical protein
MRPSVFFFLIGRNKTYRNTITDTSRYLQRYCASFNAFTGFLRHLATVFVI